VRHFTNDQRKVQGSDNATLSQEMVGFEKQEYVSVERNCPLAVERHFRAMRGSKRHNRASSSTLEPSSLAPPVSGTNAPAPARVTLPSDLPGSLKHLDDVQLQRLRDAVAGEFNRRNSGSKNETAPAVPTETSSTQSAASRKTASEFDEVPEGKANLIRASFKAGVKPAVIARTFRISQSLVNRVLTAVEKRKL
jgi:hypothetical protein